MTSAGQRRIAVVVGGSRGIGRAIAERLAREGCHVIVNFSRREDDAIATVESIERAGGSAETHQANIGEIEAIRAMFGDIGARLGRVDVLVGNAARGIERPRNALRAMPKHLRATFDVNVLGPWFCAQEAAKIMPRGGRIVNISSLGAQRYAPRYAAVGVTKAALEALTRYLAVELAPQGIAVNAVSAGLVESSEGLRMFPDHVSDVLRRRVPAGRNVQPEDIAGLVAFLCSEDAAMIVGQTIMMDGGFSLLGWDLTGFFEGPSDDPAAL
ncbi:MAG TPA: SDR family oxidoreductase [Dehalococcoidia bacterium]|nr:SDR family oxidoreductase [Dehalococcoidia bacterium]